MYGVSLFVNVNATLRANCEHCRARVGVIGYCEIIFLLRWYFLFKEHALYELKVVWIFQVFVCGIRSDEPVGYLHESCFAPPAGKHLRLDNNRVKIRCLLVV